MNSHEKLLIALLREALVANIEAKVREFEGYYWPLRNGAIPYDTRLGKAINEFAQDLEYFEPNSEWRKHSGLYDEAELRNRIDSVLHAVPAEPDS